MAITCRRIRLDHRQWIGIGRHSSDFSGRLVRLALLATALIPLAARFPAALLALSLGATLLGTGGLDLIAGLRLAIVTDFGRGRRRLGELGAGLVFKVDVEALA